MDLLGVTAFSVEVFAGKVKLADMLYLELCFFTSTISIIVA